MNYQFPVINHIDDVLPAIAGSKEFVVARRDWGTVINYLVSTPDTFPDVDSVQAAIRRECRGLLFYPDGRVMSRRLHKFFNLNERSETQLSQIDLSQPHVILDKLDGSMITPIYAIEGIRWGTKMGITHVALQAEEYAAGRSQYGELAAYCKEQELTPIFEWCSRQQRIVVDYPEDRMVLIAIRKNRSGEYISYSELVALGEQYNIEVVKTYPGTLHSMSQLVEQSSSLEDAEGWILRFDNGHMLKVKGEWYLRIHRIKELITLEKNVVDLIVNDKLDDVKPFVLEDDRYRLEEFERRFWQGFDIAVETYDRYWNSAQAAGLDRRSFAVQWMPTVQKSDPFAAQFVFGKFDGKDSRQMLLDQIRKNTGTATKINTVRHLWTGVIWSYHYEQD